VAHRCLLHALRYCLRVRRLATGVFRIGANRVLVYPYLVTLTGVISGILLFEDFRVNKLVGGTILLGGVYLA
jgi:hypothetical protein